MPDYSYRGKMSLHPYDPRFTAIAPPTVGIFDEPQMSICFNVEWAAHLDGVIARLLWTDAWSGTPETQQFAVLQITKLLTSMIARNPCGGGGGMDCCDEIIARIDALAALLGATGARTEKQIRDDVRAVEESYEQFIEDIEAVYDDDILNVHPDMAYGDDDDAFRDQALCFICQRFVDIMCDWIVQNINLKAANQQTILNIAGLIGAGSDILARIAAETALGSLFQTIDTVLDLEIAAATEWITSVTTAQLSIYQDIAARSAVACEWYKQLKGETPTLSRFLSSLYAASLTGNADTIRLKLGDALTPVDVPMQPDGERLYFIWSDLWQEAYDGAVSGILPEECECENWERDLPDDNGWSDFTLETFQGATTTESGGKIIGATNNNSQAVFLNFKITLDTRVTSITVNLEFSGPGPLAQDFNLFIDGVIAASADMDSGTTATLIWEGDVAGEHEFEFIGGIFGTTATGQYLRVSGSHWAGTGDMPF